MKAADPGTVPTVTISSACRIQSCGNLNPISVFLGSFNSKNCCFNSVIVLEITGVFCLVQFF